MQMIVRVASALSALLLIAGPAAAEIPTSKGAASAHYAGPTAPPEVRDQALHQAELNALERYMAETNPAKQRLFDAARDRLLASLDSYVLSATPLSETDDPARQTYSLVVRIEINAARFENALADASGVSAARTDGTLVALVIVSRTPASVQSFDDHFYKRADLKVTGAETGSTKRTTRESESIGANAVGTGDTVSEHGSHTASESAVSETGGSTTRKADKVEWAVANSSEVDQQMTGVLENAGLQVVSAEFVDKLNLAAIRKDFGHGDDLEAATMQAMAAAIRANGIRFVTLGTMDQGMAGKDPVTGAARVDVIVNAKVYDMSGRFPRVVSAVASEPYAGTGSDPMVAKANAIKLAAEQVAHKVVDELAVKGVR